MFFAAAVALLAAPLPAQQVLDRVLARVGDSALTLTDLRAARALGIVDAPAGPAGDAEALDRMIERRLAIVELARFPQPEPDPAVIDAEVARLSTFAGARLSEVMQANGIDQPRLREIARDSIRIRAYLDDRFPLTAANDSDAQQYYKSHQADFTRNGVVQPFEAVAPAARAAVAEAARRVRIARWLDNLRARIDVVITRG